ncbi:MAG: hypothetical protein M1818_006668 [Claussenomyces sp. TS43310]|nr:MAG: hypothetical protein M1818_006668 [Claussenomyces sp. TS43310]
MFLFGGSEPWSPDDWTSSDDRVRGGASRSHLDFSSESSSGGNNKNEDESPSTLATFHGTLDITTLGGAGFASQRTTGDDRSWDVSAHDGLELDIVRTDGKRYTLNVKDEILPARDDGREQSSVSWEFDFAQPAPGRLFVAWRDLTPTYRGREVKDPRPLDLTHVRRFGIMMRSFFGEQEGNFALVVRSIAVVKKGGSSSAQAEPRRSLGDSMETLNEKDDLPQPERQGWLRWMFGRCGIL